MRCARLKASVAGQIVLDPKPSASRWSGQSVRAAGARVEGQDRDVLAELAEARDQAATREGDVVRVRGDEDVGHGGRSIAGRSWPEAVRSGVQPASPMSGTNTHGPSDHSRHSSPWRSTTSSCCSWRVPTGMTSRPPSPSCSRSASGSRARRPRRRSRPTARRPGPRACRRRSRTSIRSRDSPRRREPSPAALAARSGSRSIEVTRQPSSARIAAW